MAPLAGAAGLEGCPPGVGSSGAVRAVPGVQPPPGHVHTVYTLTLVHCHPCPLQGSTSHDCSSSAAAAALCVKTVRLQSWPRESHACLP